MTTASDINSGRERASNAQRLAVNTTPTASGVIYTFADRSQLFIDTYGRPIVMTTKAKPGPKVGTSYLKDPGDRLVNLPVRLKQRTLDKLRKLGKPTLLVRDAVEDKYGG